MSPSSSSFSSCVSTAFSSPVDSEMVSNKSFTTDAPANNRSVLVPSTENKDSPCSKCASPPTVSKRPGLVQVVSLLLLVVLACLVTSVRLLLLFSLDGDDDEEEAKEASTPPESSCASS